MKDWLALLGFDVSAGRLIGYVPPFDSEQWRRRFGFMEPAGDRWWAVGGAVYMLQAIKRVRGMRLITPAWQEKAAREKRRHRRRQARGRTELAGGALKIVKYVTTASREKRSTSIPTARARAIPVRAAGARC